MLEQFFGSKTRFKLLHFFFNHSEGSFYVRELVRKTGMQLNSIRRELENLVKFGIIFEDKAYKGSRQEMYGKNSNLPIRRKYFKINLNFVLYKELETLIIKSKLLLEHNLIEKITNLGKIKLLILTGIFTGVKNSSVDILIIGSIDNNDFKNLISKFNKYVNRDINYSILSKEEYKYRWDIKDKFLFDIIEQDKIEIKE